MSQRPPSRRTFLTGAAIAGAALGIPTVVKAQGPIAIDLFQGMGAVVSPLPAEEIVSAIDRGVLDAAAFNNASSDRLLGFADVSKICMLQSYHQNAEQLEIVVNKTRFNALPDAMKAIVENGRGGLGRYVVEVD